MTLEILFIATIFLLLFSIILIYNTLVVRRNKVNNAYSSIDAMLKKRYDLIPNLIKTVKQYMKYEESLLNQLTELRIKAITGNLDEQQRDEINSKIGTVLRDIIVSAENYPELKASTNFLQLQAALNEVEEQLSAARRAFSAAVTEYNNAVHSFPTNIIASLFNFKETKWFEIPIEEKQLIDVDEFFKKDRNKK